MSKYIFQQAMLAKLGDLLIELYALKLAMGSQQWLACLPSSWLVSQATSLSRHLVEHGFNSWHKSTTMWKASWGPSHWKPHNNPTTSKIALNDIKEVYLSKEWFFSTFREATRLPPPQGFSRIRMQDHCT
jgi:hypothetical protein